MAVALVHVLDATVLDIHLHLHTYLVLNCLVLLFHLTTDLVASKFNMTKQHG